DLDSVSTSLLDSLEERRELTLLGERGEPCPNRLDATSTDFAVALTVLRVSLNAEVMHTLGKCSNSGCPGSVKAIEDDASWRSNQPNQIPHKMNGLDGGMIVEVRGSAVLLCGWRLRYVEEPGSSSTGIIRPDSLMIGSESALPEDCGTSLSPLPSLLRSGHTGLLVQERSGVFV